MDEVVNGRVCDTKLPDRADCLEEATEILPEHGGVPPDAQTSYVGCGQPLSHLLRQGGGDSPEAHVKGRNPEHQEIFCITPFPGSRDVYAQAHQGIHDMNGEVARLTLAEEVSEEWRKSCGDIRHNSIEEEVGFDVLEFIGEREEVKQSDITCRISVECQATEARKEDRGCRLRRDIYRCPSNLE